LGLGPDLWGKNKTEGKNVNLGRRGLIVKNKGGGITRAAAAGKDPELYD